MDIRAIINKSGLTINSFHSVGGGDINDAYCLVADEKKYFLKINDAARFPRMFEKEARGLTALEKESRFVIPKVIQHGEVNGRQFLVLEWLEKGRPLKNFWEDFGTAVADMHKTRQNYFGFEEDNYIGSLQQNNTKHESWPGFYTNCRVMPLIRKLKDAGRFSTTDIAAAEVFCKQLDTIFPSEYPSLLHGDLWGGNYMISENGRVAIYDPAVYFGHREMDLGMTLLFGGFSAPFYEAYHQTYPLEKGWRQRIRCTQLYPLLVHAILFDGQYLNSVKEILRTFK